MGPAFIRPRCKRAKPINHMSAGQATSVVRSKASLRRTPMLSRHVCAESLLAPPQSGRDRPNNAEAPPRVPTLNSPAAANPNSAGTRRVASDCGCVAVAPSCSLAIGSAAPVAAAGAAGTGTAIGSAAPVAPAPLLPALAGTSPEEPGLLQICAPLSPIRRSQSIALCATMNLNRDLP